MALPDAERAAFEDREMAIAAADAEVDAARTALDQDQSVELGERAERDADSAVDAAKDERALVKGQATTEVEVARLDQEATEHEHDGSKQAVREARQERALARTRGDKTEIDSSKGAVASAKGESVASKQETTTASAAVQGAKRDRDTDVAVTQDNVDDAAVAHATAEKDVDEAKHDLEVATRNVALMEARSEAASATLELDKAKAVARAGTPVDVAMFEAAVASAQRDLAKAEREAAAL